MGVSALFRPMCGGVPDWDPQEPGERLWIKLPRHFRATFSNLEPMNEAHGEQLATWASGKSLAASAQFDELMRTITSAASTDDLEALTAQLKTIPERKSLPPAQYKQLRQAWSRRRNELAASETYDDTEQGEREAIGGEAS